jgi:hypothetical protein
MPRAETPDMPVGRIGKKFFQDAARLGAQR